MSYFIKHKQIIIKFNFIPKAFTDQLESFVNQLFEVIKKNLMCFLIFCLYKNHNQVY